MSHINSNERFEVLNMKTLKNIVTLISALSSGLLAGALLITIMFNVCNVFIHKDIVEQRDSFIESCEPKIVQ